MKLAVLGVLANLEKAYSIAGVVIDQLRMLHRAGHDLIFVTTSDFQDTGGLPPGVSVRTYDRYHKPVVECDYNHLKPYVDLVSGQLQECLSDREACLTHDVLFLRDFAPVNWAMRHAAADLPDLRWFHWMHSAPSPHPRKVAYPFTACFAGMVNSRYISVNRTDVPRFRDMYQVPEAHVRTVHNVIDPPSAFTMHPLADELYRGLTLYDADIVCAYPTRMVSAKQIDKLIKLIACLKRAGQSVRLIICNSYSASEQESKLIEGLSQLALEWGLSEGEFVFTSRFTSSWAKDSSYELSQGIPHKAVMDLLALSDLFIQPSVSEACPIIMLEAGLAKALVVLNQDLQICNEFLGQEMAFEETKRGVAFSFGSVTRPVSSYYPDEKSWFEERANKIIAIQASDKALEFFKYVRKYHSEAWVYRHQLLPLLTEVGHCSAAPEPPRNVGLSDGPAN